MSGHRKDPDHVAKKLRRRQNALVHQTKDNLPDPGAREKPPLAERREFGAAFQSDQDQYEVATREEVDDVMNGRRSVDELGRRIPMVSKDAPSADDAAAEVPLDDDAERLARLSRRHAVDHALRRGELHKTSPSGAGRGPAR